MSEPVSVVIPALFDPDQFERSLPPLLAALRGRDAEDEVLVVDDSGEGRLAPWMRDHFPGVTVHSRKENGGFAAALTEGIRRARHRLVFCMNPDVVVHAGFLEPLVACLEDEEVHSAVPRILLGGVEQHVESVGELRMASGLCVLEQPGLRGRAAAFAEGERPVPYAVGGAMLLRREEFLAEGGGFDPLFEPFYWEDVDLGVRAWRCGRRVVYQPASVVEHHHRGTIRGRVRKDLVRAVQEKNRLLFTWKHLDDPREIQEHVAALHRWAIDAWLQDEREELVWLALALDQVEDVRAARAAAAPAAVDFATLRERSALDAPPPES